MKKIFVSHPLTGNIEGNRKIERQLTKEIIAAGAGLPISPLQLFGFIEEETEEQRKPIMEICKDLIKVCDEVWIYGDSPGCKEEKEFAERIGKKVVIKNKGE